MYYKDGFASYNSSDNQNKLREKRNRPATTSSIWQHCWTKAYLEFILHVIDLSFISTWSKIFKHPTLLFKYVVWDIDDNFVNHMALHTYTEFLFKAKKEAISILLALKL